MSLFSWKSMFGDRSNSMYLEYSQLRMTPDDLVCLLWVWVEPGSMICNRVIQQGYLGAANLITWAQKFSQAGSRSQIQSRIQGTTAGLRWSGHVRRHADSLKEPRAAWADLWGNGTQSHSHRNWLQPAAWTGVEWLLQQMRVQPCQHLHSGLRPSAENCQAAWTSWHEKGFCSWLWVIC